MRQSTKQRPDPAGYQCPDCEKSFPTEAGLRDHLRIVHQEMGIELKRPGRHSGMPVKKADSGVPPSAQDAADDATEIN